MYLIAFPLLLIPFAIYNMIAFLLGLSLDDTLFVVPLLDQRTMPVTTGDALVGLSVLLLYLELLKVTRLNRKLVTDHILSLILFGGMVFEFLSVPKAATSTFLILLTLSFVDVIGGLSLVNRMARAEELAALDEISPEL
jgi:hypothetical protein